MYFHFEEAVFVENDSLSIDIVLHKRFRGHLMSASHPLQVSSRLPDLLTSGPLNIVDISATR